MNIGEFVKKVQTADETTKRKWVFWCTVVTTCVVVFVWFSYFNTILGTNQAVASADESHGSMLDAARRGAASVYEGFLGFMEAVRGAVTSPRTYNIKPPQ